MRTLTFEKFRLLENHFNDKVEEMLGGLSYLQLFTVSRHTEYIMLRDDLIRWLRQCIIITPRGNWLEIPATDPIPPGTHPLSHPIIAALLRTSTSTITIRIQTLKRKNRWEIPR